MGHGSHGSWSKAQWVTWVTLSDPFPALIQMQVQVMTTYEKDLHGVTGSTQGADALLIGATHILKNIIRLHL